MPYSETVRERAEQIINDVITPMGYELVEVTYTPGKNSVLTAYIYKKGGVTLDDCVAVNDALDAPLEANDITGGKAYTLNISSPGLDRPIVTDKDLERNMGEELEAVTEPVTGRKKIKTVGVLTSYDADSVVLTSEKGETVLPRADIKSLKVYIDLKKIK